MRRHYDVVIVGGGVTGCSAAFWLTRRSGVSVLLLEPDPTLARSATALSVASIRQQFTTRVNVAISRFGIGFIRDFPDWTEGAGRDLHLVENGYLFLAGSAEAAVAMNEAASMQRDAGASTELLAPDVLAGRFPWMDVSDVVQASFGPRDEGWFDNLELRHGLLRAAQRQGTEVAAAAAVAVTHARGCATGVCLASGEAVAAGAVVLSAGAATAGLLDALGETLPIENRKRTVFVLDAPDAVAPDAPLIIDHTGIYFRPEGRCWIAAAVPAEDGPAEPGDYTPDWSAFQDVVWPKLAARSSRFERARLLRAWAGHYDYNRLDQNAVVGAWPAWQSLYVAAGFSGHGLQQAPAVGRGLAELILDGGLRSLDLSDLAPERLVANRPLREAAIV